MSAGATPGSPLLEVESLVKEFRLPREQLWQRAPTMRAVNGVSFAIGRGETFGLVGESGSGKSTVARMVVRLTDPTSGSVRIDGADVVALKSTALRELRRRVQIVFQDPYSSFDPLTSLLDSVGEPLQTYFDLDARARSQRVAELLDLVGLSGAYRSRYPSQLSGGQLQRAAIARGLAVEPELLVLDEPVSALDVSTQAQVINLLQDLQERLGVSYLLIAHDLSVVEHISHRVGVMYLGEIVETGPTDVVYRTPTHPYTMTLLSAVPVPNPRVQRARRRLDIEGDIPSPALRPSGCAFRTRCPFVMDVCSEVEPADFVTPDGVTVRCHLHTHGPRLAGASVRDLVTTS
jgi:peptide/nickel transport system ATP-binding protein